MNYFFYAAHTKAKDLERNFLMYRPQDKNNDIRVIIRGSEVTLNYEDYEEFCSIIDQYTSCYLNELIKIEKQLKSTFFEFSKTQPDSYELLTIDRTIWNKVVAFYENHNIENGHSDWHVFYPKTFSLDVYFKQSPLPSFNLFPEGNGPLIRILWKPESENSVDQIEIWNATTISNWIKEELIPYVLYNDYLSSRQTGLFKSFFFKPLNYMQYKKNLDFQSIYFENPITSGYQVEANNLNLDKVLKIVSWIQETAKNGFYLNINTNLLNSSINALIFCLKNTSLDEHALGYIKSKIRFEGSKNDTHKVIQFLTERKKENIKEFKIRASYLDHYFRSIKICLELNKKILNNRELIEFLEKIELVKNWTLKNYIINKYRKV